MRFCGIACLKRSTNDGPFAGSVPAKSWREVSFENLALSDGRRVSGSRTNGHITCEYVK